MNEEKTIIMTPVEQERTIRHNLKQFESPSEMSDETMDWIINNAPDKVLQNIVTKPDGIHGGFINIINDGFLQVVG